MKKSQGLSTFFASCPREMETMLDQELDQFGIEDREVKKGGVRFKADDLTGIQFLIHTRLASRVFKSFAFMKVRNEKDLYNKAKTEPWLKALTLNQTFKIQTLFDHKSKAFFKNSVAVSQILKDAIVDHFREKKGERPSVDTKDPDVNFLLRIEGGRGDKGWNCSVFIDLCGSPLSNRGYRQRGHSAPIRENLAAALVLASEFDGEEDVFYDPMCGSGTILIEAILIKGKIPPTYLRILRNIERKEKSFAFLEQVWFKEKTFLTRDVKEYLQQTYEQINKSIDELEHFQFYGSDIQARNLNLCREHLENAGLPSDIVELEKGDATKITLDIEAPGVVVTNPPYGERLGATDEVKELYYNLGENLKNNYKGFRAFILTSNPELRKKIALQTAKRIPFFNGNIECRLLRYDIR